MENIIFKGTLAQCEEYEDDYICSDVSIIEERDNDHMIEVCEYAFYIPKLNLYLRNGIYSNFDTEENDYVPDFCLTAIYDSSKTGDESYLYFEQDPYVVSLANFLRITHQEMTIDFIRRLETYIVTFEPDTVGSRNKTRKAA